MSFLVLVVLNAMPRPTVVRPVVGGDDAEVGKVGILLRPIGGGLRSKSLDFRFVRIVDDFACGDLFLGLKLDVFMYVVGRRQRCVHDLPVGVYRHASDGHLYVDLIGLRRGAFSRADSGLLVGSVAGVGIGGSKLGERDRGHNERCSNDDGNDCAHAAFRTGADSRHAAFHPC